MTTPTDDLATLDGALQAVEGAAGDDRLALLCFLAGGDVVLDEHELAAALRRSELLLAAGGDPRRPLELHSRAVAALADDLDEPCRRVQLAAGLTMLIPASNHLPGTAIALERLIHDADLAWLAYAMARLADHLAHGG